MDATFHAPADTAPARARFDAFRTSAIAKPQKAFAVAFAVMAAALAGCASGLGASSNDSAQAGRIARVEEGAIVAARAITIEASQSSAQIGAQPGHAYTIRLPSGELVSVEQAGGLIMPTGTPVLIEYGARARVLPQNTPDGV